MNSVKTLGSQTIIYGLSSIVPKFLSYFLNPLYTYNFGSMQIGQVTLLYTFVIFINLILTYGLETGFFYFSRREGNSNNVFGTAFYSLCITTSLFVILCIIWISSIVKLIEFTENPRYVIWFIFIIAFDTLSAIPFAKLRFQNKAFRFALYKLLTVGLNVILNFISIWLIPLILKHTHGTFFGFTFKLDIEIIFICNFISSLFGLLILLPIIVQSKPVFHINLLKQMLVYSIPLMFAGLAGTINDTIDRILLKVYLPHSVNAISEIGIYGANIKLSVIMVLFVQMFRFAAEPFFFSKNSGENQDTIIGEVSKYFVLYGLIIFLGVMAYVDILKYYVGPREYWVGLKIVPSFILAKLMLGVYFNLSFWYKLSGKTYFGLIIMVIGSILTVILNILFIPVYSYFGSSVIQLVVYTVMTLISFYLSKKYSKIDYQFKSILIYGFIAIIFFGLMYYVNTGLLYINLLKNTILLALFIIILERKEHILSLYFKK